MECGGIVGRVRVYIHEYVVATINSAAFPRRRSIKFCTQPHFRAYFPSSPVFAKKDKVAVPALLLVRESAETDGPCNQPAAHRPLSAQHEPGLPGPWRHADG